MADKEFGGCNIDPEAEARERRVSAVCPNTPPLSTIPEVEKVRKQCEKIVEEGRGIF